MRLVYKITIFKSPGSYKTSPDISPPPKVLLLHCRQTYKVKNELDGQPSRLLTSMHAFNYNASLSPPGLVFLELEDIHQYLDFIMLDENNNEVIPRAFYLQLLNK